MRIRYSCWNLDVIKRVLLLKQSQEKYQHNEHSSHSCSAEDCGPNITLDLFSLYLEIFTRPTLRRSAGMRSQRKSLIRKRSRKCNIRLNSTLQKLVSALTMCSVSAFFGTRCLQGFFFFLKHIPLFESS